MRGSLLARRGWAGTAPDKELGEAKVQHGFVMFRLETVVSKIVYWKYHTKVTKEDDPH